jgi:hypothetical protein
MYVPPLVSRHRKALASIGGDRRLRSRLTQTKEPAVQRRRIKQLTSPGERLDQAQQLRKQAQGTPPGIEREWLMRRARQAEIAKQMHEWIISPGLQLPK